VSGQIRHTKSTKCNRSATVLTELEKLDCSCALMKLILIVREECRQGTNGFQMVSPLLHVGLLQQGGGGRGRRHQGRTEVAQGKRKGREGAGHGGCLYRRILNIQRSRFNYSHVIHPTSESSM
jgi:hypothetical protein